MNLFDTLLEIKTGKKDLLMKAVYISNSTSEGKGAYYIYYYDNLNHAFYINDLDYSETDKRASTTNVIENIISQAYKQEMNSFVDILRKIHFNQKPKVFYFHNQKNSGHIIIDKVNLKTVRGSKGEILGFKNPSWGNDSSEKIKLVKE